MKACGDGPGRGGRGAGSRAARGLWFMGWALPPRGCATATCADAVRNAGPAWYGQGMRCSWRASVTPTCRSMGCGRAVGSGGQRWGQAGSGGAAGH